MAVERGGMEISMKRIISLILTLALAAVFYIPASASAGSLDGWLTGYSGTLEAKAELDTTEYHSGSASVKLSRKTAEKSNVYMNFQQSVPVEEGKTYQYGFWAKAKNINRISTLIDWGARAYLNPITSTYDWTYFSFKYTHNKASGNVAFKIIVDGPSAAFWIDDVEFCEYNDGMLGPNLIKNPGFEGTDSADSDKVEEDSLLEDEFTKESYYNEIAASSIIPVYKKTDIVIDGDISDWDGATKLELPKLETQVQEYSTSEIDAKVSMSFAYDENYFYFLTTAEDDVFYDLSGSEYWQGDSIQLCLSQEGESFGAEIGYSYSDNGGGKYALDFGENQMSGLLLNTSRSGNTTYYESAIPWELYYGEFKDEILFSAIYNDNDGSGRKYAIQLSEGISEGKVNTDFPIFRMVPEECGFFAWSEGPDSATV